MGVGTCHPCAKYLLFILNLFFWLSGAALIVLGVLFLIRPEVQSAIHVFNYTSLPLSSLEISAICIIIVGLIIFLIGLFGLCGAKHDSRTFLTLYIIVVTCVLLIELALFTYIAMYHDQWEGVVKKRLVSQMKKYNHLNSNQYEQAIDYIQSKYHCCGVDSVYDYGDSLLPKSCCSMLSTYSSSATCTVHQVSSSGAPGCYRLLTKAATYWMKFFIIAELGLCLLSLIGVFLAICVCQNAMLYEGYIRP